MSLKKCFQCKEITYTPYSVTEINGHKSFYVYNLCEKCGKELINPSKKVELFDIKSPQQLLDFISGISIDFENETPCPKCGLTIEQFNSKIKFGCSKCYDHFKEKSQSIIFPYHKATHHVGKIPRRQMNDFWNSTPEEKMKLLKLKLAKAIELEEFEKAAQIKIEIQNQNPPSSCEDQ